MKTLVAAHFADLATFTFALSVAHVSIGAERNPMMVAAFLFAGFLGVAAWKGILVGTIGLLVLRVRTRRRDLALLLGILPGLLGAAGNLGAIASVRGAEPFVEVRIPDDAFVPVRLATLAPVEPTRAPAGAPPTVAPSLPPRVDESVAAARAYARRRLGATGYGCLDRLVERESRWRIDARNRTSGAYGIPQALPGSKMASAGADWRTNATTQIRWMIGYVEGRYGGACRALGHSLALGWY